MRQSFIVNILQQQNASWQGTVTWVDENKTQSFRSALELIRLIDSTLTDGSNNDWKEASDQKPEH
ncbi:MAG: hypothetical protein IJA84_02365 [Clostridia bacterium]|nr:hypothetical protein [Clostridia bacterium]